MTTYLVLKTIINVESERIKTKIRKKINELKL